MYPCHKARLSIKVSVVDTNLHFPLLLAISVEENIDVGAVVAKVQAFGGGNALRYTIIAGNTDDKFKIDPISGDIATTAQLDFESLNIYQLMVQAQSSIFSSLKTSAMQTIHVLDVNEAPYFITTCAVQGNCSLMATENQGVGIKIGMIPAQDQDLNNIPEGTLQFSLDPNAVPFEIDNTGNVLTAAVLDAELTNFFRFNVIASDLGSPQLSSVTEVTVHVIDLNDNSPNFTLASSKLFVAEDTINGSILAVYEATDADITPDNSRVHYFVTSSSLLLNIDPTSGVLTLLSPLDFEVEPNEYSVEVTARNSDGRSTEVFTVLIVTDVNDSPPVFVQETYEASVTEHSPHQTLVTVVATDADSEPNAISVYTIASGNFDGSFSINSSTGQISIVSDIDREKTPFFELVVQVRNLALPSFFDSATVLVSVVDINDSPPVFIPSQYNVTIRENNDVLYEALTVFAFDADQADTLNSNITYSIVGGNDTFIIDSETGRLSVRISLDYEVQESYSLLVLAADHGTPSLSGIAFVFVQVVNANESPPVIEGNQTIFVSELTLPGSVVGHIQASDLDQMELSFSIVSGNDNGMFSINETGFLILEHHLDFETVEVYIILVSVTDGQNRDTSYTTILVIEENEFAPEILPPTSFEVLEEQELGSVVGVVNAIDQDEGASGVIRYDFSISSPLFKINESDGVIISASLLDREALVAMDIFVPPTSQESLLVIARDSGNPPKFTEMKVHVILVDINDNHPTFTSPSYTGDISENMLQNTTVFQVFARDLDVGLNGQIFYSLQLISTGGSLPFQINSTTGEVTTLMPLDREYVDHYVLNVTAEDLGSPALLSSVTATVVVGDVNDNAPTFKLEYNVSVRESAPPNTLLLFVLADDADTGKNAEVDYKLDSSPEATMFSIDENGVIRLGSAASLDFETKPEIIFTALACDQGVPKLTGSTIITVAVINVDEYPPVFQGLCNAEVHENVALNTLITTCIATDFDDTTNATTNLLLKYSIVDGNAGSVFGINEGEIRNLKHLDREERDFYSLKIAAEDSGNLIDTMQVNITVLDLNDNNPLFTNLPATVELTNSRILSNTVSIARPMALDQDSGLNAQLQYTISELDKSSTVTVLTITVEDLGTPTLSSNSSLTVVFEEQCVWQNYTIGLVSGAVTVEVLCGVFVEPEEASVTLGESTMLLCSVVKNTEATYQWQHNGSFITQEITLTSDSEGQLQLHNVSYLDGGEYTCKASTRIGSLQSEISTVTLQGKSSC